MIILEGKRGGSSCVLSAVSQQLFETGPLCFCLSQVHVIVPCFSHFWNDNSETIRMFSSEVFWETTYRQKNKRWRRGDGLFVADVRRREKVEPESKVYSCAIHHVFDIVYTLEVEFVNVR